MSPDNWVDTGGHLSVSVKDGPDLGSYLDSGSVKNYHLIELKLVRDQEDKI